MANKLNIVEAVNQALMNEMENDKTVVVYGEDVGLEGGYLGQQLDYKKSLERLGLLTRL